MLWREAWMSTLTRRVPPLMVAALCASMCATTLVTVGRTASAEAQVLARLDEAGSRELVVGDRQSAGLLTPGVVRSIDSLSTVERAVGVVSPLDVRSGVVGAGGAPVPAWGVVGDIADVVTIRSGRKPVVGEAVVAETSRERIGLDGAAGFLVVGDAEYAVVGTYDAREPFEVMDAGAVVVPPPTMPADNLHVIARSVADVGRMQTLALGLIAASRPEELSIQSATSLAELQGDVAGDLVAFGRHLLVLILGAGALINGVVVLADVLLRHAELGRRRALGASRATLLALVLLRTVIAAGVGVLAGAGIGIAATVRWGTQPPWSFTAGTAVLTMLVALLAAIGPALVAATRDPVRVLRTP